MLPLSAAGLDRVSAFRSTELLQAALVPERGTFPSFSCLRALFGAEKLNGGAEEVFSRTLLTSSWLCLCCLASAATGR